jgi:hypothetical protein
LEFYLARTTSVQRSAFLARCLSPEENGWNQQENIRLEGLNESLDSRKAHLMAVIKPRNRTLIFRLTQEEYATLQAASSEKGARSLSEFARAQLFGSLETPALGQQLGELSSTVARIAQMLEGN